jgi:hypothetical protein
MNSDISKIGKILSHLLIHYILPPNKHTKANIDLLANYIFTNTNITKDLIKAYKFSKTL